MNYRARPSKYGICVRTNTFYWGGNQVINILSPLIEFSRTKSFGQNWDELKVNGAKDALQFHQHFCWNFTEYFRLQHLLRVPYFGIFLPNVVAIKSIENYFHKSFSAFVPKMLVKLIHVLSPSFIRSIRFPFFAVTSGGEQET